MASQRMKARDKKVRKMTRDGLVEKNLADQSSVRVSSRAGDIRMETRRHVGKDDHVPTGRAGSKGRNGQAARHGKKRNSIRSRDAPLTENTKAKMNSALEDGEETLQSRTGKQTGRSGAAEKTGTSYQKRAVKKEQRKGGQLKMSKGEDITSETEGSASDPHSKLKEKAKKSKTYEKHAELSQSRGDARKGSNGGTRRPQQKRRLQFSEEETGAKDSGKGSVNGKSGKTMAGKGRSIGISDKTGADKNASAGKSGKNDQAEAAKKKSALHLDEDPKTGGSPKKKRLKFEDDRKTTTGRSVVAAAMGSAVAGTVHRQIRKGDDNAAVEAALGTEAGAKKVVQFGQKSVRDRKRRQVKRAARLRARTEKAEIKSIYAKRMSEDAKLRNSSAVKKMIQKQRIKREYAKAKRTEQAMGTATVGTIDYIKKIGGKVTNFFKENRKVYISIGMLLALALLMAMTLSSCSALFMNNLIDYTGYSYMASDETLRQVEEYYTGLEADLQKRINQMRTSQSGYDEYRFNIAPIEHDPFILMSYLSAKYEVFEFDDVKAELDEIFELQYNVSTESVNETVTDTHTVRVGESLGQVVTSAYCACSICCGQWAGSPTASGVYPTANHTLAVDASNPIVPMGTKVVMNGVEYTVEDTGNLAQYGVAFDVYYDDHGAALNHGHQTWEAFLSDANGTQEIEVTGTRNINAMNTTVTNRSLTLICQERLDSFELELFNAYNHVKGNLQMFATPVEFNWYGRVRSNYGYRVNAVTGEKQMHNGMDIFAPEGTPVKAALDGKVTEVSSNDSYGNYVVIKDRDGYEIRYAHLSSVSVSAGSSVVRDDEIGAIGSTGDAIGAHLHLEILKDGERLDPIFYLETGEGTLSGGDEITDEQAQRIITEAERYLGVPYVWGGYSPSGFDCSGFVSYVLNNSGVRNWGRLTAQGLYNQCTPVSDPQPGDLIFFTGTYDAGEPVTHVGIYAGNGNMIHCGHPVQYASIYTSYWQSHFYAFGRI